MHTQPLEQLRQRFLQEQQVSLNELQDIEDPAGAAAELITERDHPLAAIAADENEALPSNPAA